VAQLKLNSDWGLALRRSLGWQERSSMRLARLPPRGHHAAYRPPANNTTIKSVDGGAGSKDVRGYIFGAVGMLVALGTLVMLVVTRTH
jgi:hypothetical protein